jgi:hypothetical protein
MRRAAATCAAMKNANRALDALKAIQRGKSPLDSRYSPWLDAFIAIKWAVHSQDGPRLTPDGEKALRDMSRERDP